MPRVPLAPLDDDDRAGLADLAAPGVDTQIWQVLAHRPPILRAMIAQARALVTEGILAPYLKALLAVRVAQINHCRY